MLIAIVQLIRLILFEVQRKLKAAGQDNKVAKYILTCLQCCFWCLEKFLKFINKNAYIEIAVYGYSFCEAARRAFDLLWRNAATGGAVSTVLPWTAWTVRTIRSSGVALAAASATTAAFTTAWSVGSASRSFRTNASSSSTDSGTGSSSSTRRM